MVDCTNTARESEVKVKSELNSFVRSVCHVVLTKISELKMPLCALTRRNGFSRLYLFGVLSVFMSVCLCQSSSLSLSPIHHTTHRTYRTSSSPTSPSDRQANRLRTRLDDKRLEGTPIDKQCCHHHFFSQRPYARPPSSIPCLL